MHNANIHLEQRNIIVMWYELVVLRMRYHTLHLDLLAVMCMRMSPCHAQLDGPIVQIPQCVTAIADREVEIKFCENWTF